jgi:hypothetical protein
MAATSEFAETTPPAKKAGAQEVDQAGALKPKPGADATTNTGTALNLNLTDWSNYLQLDQSHKGDPKILSNGVLSLDGSNPYALASTQGQFDASFAKFDGTKATDFAATTLKQQSDNDGDSAALDWLFDGPAPSGDGKTDKVTKTGKAPDGTPIKVEATKIDGKKSAVKADAGDVHVTHSADGTNVYKSDSYVATDSHGVRTITDVATGNTVEWNSKTKQGELLDKDHKVKMRFNSENEYNANVEHILSAQRGVTQFTNKEVMDKGVQAYLDARKKGDPQSQKEHIFVDPQGDYSIVAKNGTLYNYDKASGNLSVTKDGKTVVVKPGSTYQDGGQTTVSSAGVVKLGETQLDTGACSVKSTCTLTTQSDTGPVTVESGNGQSSVADPHVAATTLTDKGDVTNTEPSTQAVFSHLDPQGDLSGKAANGASFNFGANDFVINEPNGQYTLGNDDGSIATYSPDGTPLFDIDADNDVSTLSSPVNGWDKTQDADGDYDGTPADSAPVTASTAISIFAAAGNDISQADAHMDPAKATDMANRLMSDYSSLNDLADAATARGLDWAAHMLQGRAASALDAANRLAATERAERGSEHAGEGIVPIKARGAGTRTDLSESIATPEGQTHREAPGVISTRNGATDEETGL